MHGEILRARVLLIVTMLCVPASGFSVAAQEPAQTQRGVITTFAPIVEEVAPSVVTVFTTRTVSRGLTTFPFGDDTLRQFFGGQSPQRQGKQTLQWLGSGVIVRPGGIHSHRQSRGFRRGRNHGRARHRAPEIQGQKSWHRPGHGRGAVKNRREKSAGDHVCR